MPASCIRIYSTFCSHHLTAFFMVHIVFTINYTFICTKAKNTAETVQVFDFNIKILTYIFFAKLLPIWHANLPNYFIMHKIINI